MTVKATQILRFFWTTIAHLIFPNTCLACKNELAPSEGHICSFCMNDLSFTHFQSYTEPTPMDKLFWGRVDITSTYAHFNFEKNKASQEILFGLKYKNNMQVGIHFGKEIGKIIASHPSFHTASIIIPVPLHPKKQFLRGFNQSEVIARGISETSLIPIDLHLITRNKHSETQTKKDRFERWDNVSSIFSVSDNIKNISHVTIVDDVITTGSTIESIIRSLRSKNPTLSISVVTLAIA
ncbi:MAG: ComF family protein [Crocinitomicaceae bacterium]|nr:ComF family protein [Crocinitomicaceae bacterium]MDG1776668.1 ComF family protein [Crocinitomicaceae bacterium]